MSHIIKSSHNNRYDRYPHPEYVDGKTQGGLDLTMVDGSIWFHPYDGSKPRKINDACTN
jgi:hypothetical protein